MKKKLIMIISCLAVLTIVLAYTIFVVVVNRPTSSTRLYMNPKTISGTIGQDFTINISISNVNDLYGWQLKLRWNSTILDAATVAEGTFLRKGGSTFFTAPQINNTTGYILAVCTLTPDMPGQELPGVNGSGVLATVEFHVKGVGACDLILYDTMLTDAADQTIGHTVVNGRFDSTS